MRWAWRANGNGFDLVLTESHGLVFKEVTFGFVTSDFRYYDCWNGKNIGQCESMIEAKRLLIEYTLRKISMAYEDSKPVFGEPEERRKP